MWFGSCLSRIAGFAAKTNESIHFYGPGRASGVPAIAGLIMRDIVTGLSSLSLKLSGMRRHSELRMSA